MSRLDGLIPNSQRTPEELREITRKGGIASGIARKRRKLLRETLAEELNKKAKDGRLTKQEVLVKKVLDGAMVNPKPQDLKIVAEILGELKTTVEVPDGVAINIYTSEQGKRNIDDIMEGK